jgi:8-amino-7-oxononanoate synthase
MSSENGIACNSSPALAFEQAYIQPALERRRRIGSLRKLVPFHSKDAIDFSSNDYIGLAQSQEQSKKVQAAYDRLPTHFIGSTGSRLLTGDSNYAHALENRLAKWHNRPAALLCNSGYDANLSVLSCLTVDSVVIMDELIHNSLRMGVKLSKGYTLHTFLHNDLRDLKRLLLRQQEISPQKLSKPVLIVVESVYSMDGDVGPLKEILQLALDYNACVIVDEAHGLGVFGSIGTGLLAELGLEEHPALLASIHTFGKAAGCHGAVVCGSTQLKEFLYNYGQPIVYSTSLPLHSLVCIECSYESMAGPVGKRLRAQVFAMVHTFHLGMVRVLATATINLAPSQSPIQALIIPGNQDCVNFCQMLLLKSKNQIRLYPIRSPTVPKGQERVRIILHSHNTMSQVENLIRLIQETLKDMGYLDRVRRSRL